LIGHDGSEVTTTATPDIRFDVPLYTLAEAARSLGVPPTTFANWGKGYVRRFPSRKPVAGDPIVTVLARPARQPSVPFIGLAEGMILAAIRQAGVPLQRIRPALKVLATEIGFNHALASQALYTDGAELLFDYAQHQQGDEAAAARELVVVRSGQHVFTSVIEDYLQRISYGPDGYARLIRLPAYRRSEVVADPERSFGQLIFAHGGAKVSDVLDRFWAGDAIDELSTEFGVPEAEIEDVLRAASRRAA
jgi:uncharacterized protein (DUF433 family)